MTRLKSKTRRLKAQCKVAVIQKVITEATTAEKTTIYRFEQGPQP